MANPIDNAVPLSGDARIDGLVQGSAWSLGPGRVLTYSFSLYDSLPVNVWGAAERAAVTGALQAWANVANVSFQEVGSGTPYAQSGADMAFSLAGRDLEFSLGALALGMFPSPAFADQLLPLVGESRASYPRPEGDIFLDNAYPGFHLNPGGYGYEIIVHEIGHALGLKHPEDDGASGRPTFLQLGIGDLDRQNWTVMSNEPAAVDLNPGNAATPMPLDILAIQRI